MILVSTGVQASHGAEIPMVFALDSYFGKRVPFTAAEELLSKSMQSYWANFARGAYAGNDGETAKRLHTVVPHAYPVLKAVLLSAHHTPHSPYGKTVLRRGTTAMFAVLFPKSSHRNWCLLTTIISKVSCAGCLIACDLDVGMAPLKFPATAA